MTSLVRFAAALGLAAVLAGDAPAAFRFVFDRPVNAGGGAVEVGLSLQETSDTGSFVLLDEGGLITTGVKISVVGPTGFGLSDPAAVAGNPAFADLTVFVGPGELTGTPGELAGLFQSVGFDPAVQPVQVDPKTVEVFLGTFRLTRTDPARTTTVLVAGAIDPGNFAGNVTDAGTDLDALGIAPATATITAVPEPGSLVLAGVAAAGLAGWRARRRTGRSA